MQNLHSSNVKVIRDAYSLSSFGPLQYHHQFANDNHELQLLLNNNYDINQGYDKQAYWHEDDEIYSEQERIEMGSWLLDKKGIVDIDDINVKDDISFDINKLNDDQLFAYKIVQKNLDDKMQILLRIEGFAGN